MRILLATDAWRPQVNGVVRTLENIVRIGEAAGDQVSVLEPSLFRGFSIRSYRGIRIATPSYGHVKRMVTSYSPDVIHVATEGPIGLIARTIARRNAIPLTSSFHTRFDKYLSSLYSVPPLLTKCFLKRFHSASHSVLVPTPNIKDALEAEGFRNVVLWPRGVDTAIYRPLDIERERGKPVLLCVSRLSPEKNVEDFARIKIDGHKIVIGDGPLRGYLERTYTDTRFLGHKSEHELMQYYNCADLLVFPSKTDTFGNVLLEALACGLPVAAYPQPGPRYLINSTAVGSMSEDLSHAILSALECSRKSAYQRSTDFSWEASYQILRSQWQLARKPDLAQPTGLV